MSQPSLNDLMALNDEIAALVRAGVPLQFGLRQLSSGISGRLGELSNRLSERMEGGASLQQALRDEGAHAPDVYVAIVEAGIRSNRLPEALESVSSLSRSLLELHRRVVLALVYPLIVVVVAYGTFVFFVKHFVAGLDSLLRDLRIEPGWALETLNSARASLPFWGPAIPIIVGIVGAWLTYGQPTEPCSLVPRFVFRFRWLPWIRKAMDQFDYAAFAKLAALLIRHQASLHEAILLAGHATGNNEIIAEVNQLSERLKNGDSLPDALENANHMPKFMKWMMTIGANHGTLDAAFIQASEVYESRAKHNSHWAQVTLPVFLMIGVAGVSVLLYSLAVFHPVLELYDQLSRPIG